MKARENRWIYLPLIFAAFVALSAGAATGNLELPAWDSGGGVPPYYPGGGLWPDGSLPEGALACIQQISVEKPEPVPTEYVVLKDEPGITIEPVFDPEIHDDLPRIEDNLQEQFFGEKPSKFLIDPQGLITEQKANDVLRFLEIHSGESRFSIYPIVLGKHQSIPEQIDLHELHQDWFGETPTLLLTYSVRDPESLRIIFNREVALKIPASSLAGIRESCIREAKLADNGPDQLEKIAIELSIQAFWVEKLMDREPLPSEPEVTPIEEVVSRTPVNPAVAPAVNSPVAPATRPAEMEGIASIIREWLESTITPGLLRGLVIGSSAILLLALILFLKNVISRRGSLREGPVLFPSYTKKERLGGEFTGGAFVGISFELGRSDGRFE